MKVILISKVANFGNIGDIVEVKPGFARNFLIPTNKAIHYSKENQEVFENQKKEFEAKNQEALKKANDDKKAINGKDVVIIENASDDGRLYGAVNSGIIASKVNEIVKDLEVNKSNIILEKPIKETGVYDVVVDLYGDINAKLRLIVSRSEAEIETVIKQAQEKEKADKKAQKEEETTVKKEIPKEEENPKTDSDTKEESSKDQDKAVKEEATA